MRGVAKRIDGGWRMYDFGRFRIGEDGLIGGVGQILV